MQATIRSSVRKRTWESGSSAEYPAERTTDLALPIVSEVERAGSVLRPSPLPDQPDVLSLNVTQGCFHRCAFCSVRASPSYPDDSASIYRDLASLLDRELSALTHKPRAIYLSPSSDPCPPDVRIQRETGSVVSVLAKHGVEAWLMTRGYVKPRLARVLAEHARWVKVTVALATLDRQLVRLLEPLTAPPRLRLRQVQQMRANGIDVKIAVEPMIPGLTDTRASLMPVLDAVAATGIRDITAGYLMLRPAIEQLLRPALETLGMKAAVADAFQGGPMLTGPKLAPARYLSKPRRQRGYATLMALAANYGLTVRVSRLTNPDFLMPPERVASFSTQRLLFPELSRN